MHNISLTTRSKKVLPLARRVVAMIYERLRSRIREKDGLNEIFIQT